MDRQGSIDRWASMDRSPHDSLSALLSRDRRLSKSPQDGLFSAMAQSPADDSASFSVTPQSSQSSLSMLGTSVTKAAPSGLPRAHSVQNHGDMQHLTPTPQAPSFEEMDDNRDGVVDRAEYEHTMQAWDSARAHGTNGANPIVTAIPEHIVTAIPEHIVSPRSLRPSTLPSSLQDTQMPYAAHGRMFVASVLYTEKAEKTTAEVIALAVIFHSHRSSSVAFTRWQAHAATADAVSELSQSRSDHHVLATSYYLSTAILRCLRHWHHVAQYSPPTEMPHPTPWEPGDIASAVLDPLHILSCRQATSRDSGEPTCHSHHGEAPNRLQDAGNPPGGPYSSRGKPPCAPGTAHSTQSHQQEESHQPFKKDRWNPMDMLTNSGGNNHTRSTGSLDGHGLDVLMSRHLEGRMDPACSAEPASDEYTVCSGSELGQTVPITSDHGTGGEWLEQSIPIGHFTMSHGHSAVSPGFSSASGGQDTSPAYISSPETCDFTVSPEHSPDSRRRPGDTAVEAGSVHAQLKRTGSAGGELEGPYGWSHGPRVSEGSWVGALGRCLVRGMLRSRLRWLRSWTRLWKVATWLAGGGIEAYDGDVEEGSKRSMAGMALGTAHFWRVYCRKECDEQQILSPPESVLHSTEAQLWRCLRPLTRWSIYAAQRSRCVGLVTRRIINTVRDAADHWWKQVFIPSPFLCFASSCHSKPLT